MALGSACGWPGRSCQPSPTISLSSASTAPTRGFGCVLYSPRSASSSARRIAASSKALNSATAPPLRFVRRIAGQQFQLVLARDAAAAMPQPLDFFAEGLDVLEMPVDR